MSEEIRTVHLISNAHLDPVWQWEWEEGAAAAVSTFRAAADLCEQFPGFLFNHNEALLYQWIREYEPGLFDRIARLVRKGRWHVMGGWFLQPDCNMTSGETLVRQILAGRAFFSRTLGVEPRTAINFDPFGHPQGLVQILAKSGYDSYLFCRPDPSFLSLPDDDFTWVGCDGSTVVAHRSSEFYISALGKAREKVEAWLRANPGRDPGLVLWGVGDHGGGPSRLDLERLAELARTLAASAPVVRLRHSSPETYFEALRASGRALPRVERDLNPWGVGSYTSQARIKRRFRELEGLLYATERMSAHAALAGLIPWPRGEIAEAQRDLLIASFHDILPGSSVQPVEEMGLRVLDHGAEILSRVRARAFFAIAGGQPPAADGAIPILCYNPHPWPVTRTLECEFMLEDQNWEDTWTVPTVMRGGEPVPTQLEQELGNLNLDWRKRVAFRATLAPASMNRFDCRLNVVAGRPVPSLPGTAEHLQFRTDALEVWISRSTGLVDRFAVRGREVLAPGALAPVVVEDSDDPWEMRQTSFAWACEPFTLMDPERGTRFSGLRGSPIPSVRVVEDGAVRTVVEVLLACCDSSIVQTLKLPRSGTEVELDLRIYWQEKSRMLKLVVPTLFPSGRYRGEVAFGAQWLETGREVVSQRWTAVVDEKADLALTVINDGTYGSDFRDGTARISLLRSPAYAAHPIKDRPVVPPGRFRPRIDQGERECTFRINAGPVDERMTAVGREAQVAGEPPFALSFFPGGHPGPAASADPVLVIEGEGVQCPAFKAAEDGRGFIVRLFESTGRAREATLSLPLLGIRRDLRLGPFEVRTLRVEPGRRRITETDLTERPWSTR